MPPDDVQDLFDTGGADESEESAEATDPGDDEPVRDDRQSGDEESRGDAEASVSSSTSPRDATEPPGSAMDWSTESTGETGDDEDRSPASTSTPEADSPADEDRSSTSGRDAGVHESSGLDSRASTHGTDGTDVVGDEHSSSTDTETPGGDDAAGRPSATPASPPDPEPDPGPTDADEPSIDTRKSEEVASDSTPAGRSASTDAGSEPASTGSAATGSADPSTSSASSESSRLPTGIDALDRVMGGGIPPGRLVLLVADPGVQSELIVDSVLAQRDTLFVSTDRPDWEVTKDIEPGLGAGAVDVRDHTPDSLLSGVDSLLDELGTTSNFVLDSVNELELVPRPRYRIFLSDVKRRLFDTGSIGLLTGVTVDHESARDLTLRRADIVWRLETRTVDDRIENRLSVPKFRGGAAVAETVKLELTDEVTVDSSWEDR